MTDLEYARAYWKFADQKENILQAYIRGLDIEDIVTQVFQRFLGVDFGRKLSTREVVKLHQQIEKWLENGLDERDYRLILRDIKRRKEIEQKEALSTWLLASLCVYYNTIYQKSIPMLTEIAQRSYERVFTDAQAVTGKGHSRPPSSKNVEEWMKETNPSLGRILTQRMWADVLYNRNAFLERQQVSTLNGGEFNLQSEENLRKFRSIEDKLLVKSKPTKSEPQGHHGLLDQQMTFITGHTVLKAFRDAGVKRYKFIAVLDDVTTRACRGLHGKIFRIEDAKLGVNVPPVSIDSEGQPIPHPCRSIVRAVGATEKTTFRGSGTGTPSQEHRIEQVSKVDIQNQEAVQSTLEEFEKKNVNAKMERCLVITKNGEVYIVYGDEDTVNTSLLEEKMQGSINSHNHPEQATQYSFSLEDMESFFQDGSKRMRAFDREYIYEVEKGKNASYKNFMESYSAAESKAAILVFQAGGNENTFELLRQHVVIKAACEDSGLIYKRWKNE